MLLFMALGGHLIFLAVLQFSFEVMPVAGPALSEILIGLVNCLALCLSGPLRLASPLFSDFL